MVFVVGVTVGGWWSPGVGGSVGTLWVIVWAGVEKGLRLRKRVVDCLRRDLYRLG